MHLHQMQEQCIQSPIRYHSSILWMLNSDTDLEYTELAYGASSDSGSSEEQHKSCEREHKKPKKAKARKKKKKEKDKNNEPKKNTCHHCKKYPSC